MNSLIKRLRKLADGELKTLGKAVDREIQRRLADRSESSAEAEDPPVLQYTDAVRSAGMSNRVADMRQSGKFRRAA